MSLQATETAMVGTSIAGVQRWRDGHYRGQVQQRDFEVGKRPGRKRGRVVARVVDVDPTIRQLEEEGWG